MQVVTNFKAIENQVYLVTSKDYKSIMIAPDGISLISKGVTEASEFAQAFEKGGLLSTKVKIAPEKFKSIVLEQGEMKMNFNYKSMLAMGVPPDIEFASETELNEVLAYIEKKWAFTRNDRQLTPLKATVPYFIGLLIALFVTGYVIYVNVVGGTYRTYVVLILLIKLSEKIGFIPTLLLGLAACALIIRALIRAFKNPPTEIRLEPMTY